MIINRAFYREVGSTTAGIVVVLAIVMAMTSLTWLLGRAVRGATAESVVYVLLGYQMLGRIDVLLPLAFYLGVLVTLSRWYRDNEMTVLAACGVGLSHFLRPVMLIALVLGASVAVASFYSTPLALRQVEKVKAASAQRTEPHQLAPGVFTESPATRRIFYAEKAYGNGEMEGIFVSSLEQGRQGVLVARSGHPFTDGRTGDKFVALHDGAFYEGEPGTADYRILEFSVYNLRIEPRMLAEPLVPMEGLPTVALLGQRGNPAANAELHWRLGKTAALFVLALYALVFAYTDTHRGRMSNLFVAVVVYFVYSNLLGFGMTLLQQGRVPPAAGLWWVHGGMVLAAVYLLYRRLRNRPLLVLPARRVRA